MIFCVEDEANIRELVVYTLETTGFEARGFEEGTSFFEALAEKLPELILLDIMLPGEDGMEILKKLKTSGRTKDIPVIMVTAKGAEYDKVMGLDAGADDYVTKPFGNLIVDIGGGTTDVAVISMAGLVVSASVKVAGDNFDQAIMSYVRKNHSLYIGEDAAENIKIKIGTASQEASPRTLEVKGRNVITGLPKVVTLTSEEIRIALKDATNQIVETVHGVLEKTPPELAADIVDRGIVLTGGGAMLHGMDTLIEQKTGVSTLTVQDAMSAVVVGTGKYAEVLTRMEE